MKIMSKEGAGFIQRENVDIPFEGEKSAGCAFVRTEDPQQAWVASSVLDNYKFDKKHTLNAVIWTEFDRILGVNDDFILPQSADLEDLRSYELNPHIDQYLIIKKDLIEVRANKITRTQNNGYEVLYGALHPNEIRTKQQV